MRRVTFLIILTLCPAALAQTRPSTAPAAPPPPSVDELHRMFDARQYQDVVRQVVKTLSLKGEPAAPYDRHELLRLKAESHLRLGDAEPAAKAFEEAAAAAKDEQAAALDQATAVLARRAKQSEYKPKKPSSSVGAGEGLSLLDPVARKLALRALYDDERAAAQRRLVVPDRAPLVELVGVLNVAAPIRTLELAATGATTEMDQVLEPLCKRAHALMNDELESMSSRVDKLDKSANKKRKMGSAYRKRGLAAEEKAELREFARTCEQFIEAAQRFADAAAPDTARFATIRAEARDLHERAERVLAADYSGVYDRD